ncbi:pimeloyl-ACP methyl ester carboxylesterase [Haloactinopolyspora alba]|uniref:Pimeloyl-ACP methyl ester carboxylesterase n=1 Tax=Haloactinopolyspora alba TaxID=648780 RepID=A0A2P8DVQ3_9ACTN|nr:alpha/beta hydrolase [Haloactinopolyspora alba]PSL01302.1 pimeloyl-ACP methyl ester carboxylesterase [Haloactinopolyspora alba]
MTQQATVTWRLPSTVGVSAGEVATGVFGEGPPVVLVHGTPAWSYLWRDVVPLLARRYTVHVWDLLGFGDSRLADGAEPSIATQARTLAELIEHWSLDEPRLVGHDIGGGIVLRTHLIERVPALQLALLDAAVLGPWNTTFTEHMQRHAEAYRTMPPHVFGDIVAPRLRTAVHRPMPDDVAAAYLWPWRGEAGQRRWVDQVASVSFDDTRDVVARLDRIAAETLVLWGEEDGWLDTSTADRLAAAIPGAQQSRVAGAGHFVAEDDPDGTARELLRFFDRKSA